MASSKTAAVSKQPGSPTIAGQADELRQEIKQLGQRWNRQSSDRYEQELRRGNRFITAPPVLTENLLDEVCRQLQSWSYLRCRRTIDLRPGWAWGLDSRQLLGPLLRHPVLTCLHFVRLMVLVREVDPATTARPQRDRTIGPGFDSYLRIFRKDRQQPCGLHELAIAFAEAGLDDCCLGWARLLADRRRPRLQLADDAIWPYFAERTSLLAAALALPTRTRRYDAKTSATARHNALAIIAMMPSPAPELQSTLAAIAFDGSQGERGLAQAALNQTAEPPRLVQAELTSSRWQRRAVAARWLGHLVARHAVTGAAAIGMLRRALATERSSRAGEVMRTSLHDLATITAGEPCRSGPEC